MSYDNYDTGCLCIFLLAGVSEIDRFPSLIFLHFRGQPSITWAAEKKSETNFFLTEAFLNVLNFLHPPDYYTLISN